MASKETLFSHQTTLQCLFWVQKCSKISQQVTLISQDAAELPKKWHDFLSLSQLLKVMQERHKILHLHRILLQSLTHLETQYIIMFTPALCFNNNVHRTRTDTGWNLDLLSIYSTLMNAHVLLHLFATVCLHPKKSTYII